jgi:hypothetical protein
MEIPAEDLTDWVVVEESTELVFHSKPLEN